MAHPARFLLLDVFAVMTLAGCGLGSTVKPSNTSDTAGQWMANVENISAADENAGRRAAIVQRLEALRFTVKRTAFTSGKREGVNLTADITGLTTTPSSTAPLLLLGAHSDKVKAGRGATDNASGSAVVLALAERFRQHPLKHHRVGIAFWDLEENGLLGAMAYIADHIETGRGEKPALYVNFDVFGWGDGLWMMTPDATHPLVVASQAAADRAGITLSAGDTYPPTDHGAFLKAGWPAVSYSLVDKSEIPRILSAYDGKKPDPPAKVMQVIHSDHDTVAQLNAQEVARGIDAVEDALRRWDAAFAD